jgi:beta-N-acetylhexosaminidase
LQDLLRDHLGFQGVVISDSMNMHAMKRNYRSEESAVQAFVAGVDLLMLAEEHYDHDASVYLKQQTDLLNAVKAAVNSGQLPMERVNQAVERVLTLKARHGLLDSAASSQANASSVGSAEHRAIELDISRGAVAVLRNKRKLLPLAPSAPVVLVNTTKRESYAILGATRGIGPNQTQPAFENLAEAMQEKFAQVQVVSAETLAQGNFNPGPDAFLIAVTENYPLPGTDFDQSSQLPILRQLSLQFPERLIVAALRDPYELSALGDLDTYICAFSFRPSACRALAEVLCGERQAVGKTPVTIPNTEFTANQAVEE